MLAKIQAAQIIGLETDIIDVEVDVGKGLHSFTIVGLPDKAVEEARDRISAAIKNSGFKSPQKGNKKIVVSLAPANLKKEGTAFDLAIALGYLAANDEIAFPAAKRLFLGELSLSGELRPIKGALLLVKEAFRRGFTEVYLPQANTREAALVHGLKIYGIDNLTALINHLREKPLGATETPTIRLTPVPATEISFNHDRLDLDFADIRGQATAKRGLEIAAAGGHNVAMTGPPGTGKTMLAKAFAGILPPLVFQEIVEVTGIHSTTGTLINEVVTSAPFRSPHHTASYVSLVGGGAWPRPGEITLAHRGVLFLDEFPEFEKRVIEALRQPLEDRIITVARAKQSIMFPANFILIAAMNPCPCGYRNHRERECVCNPATLARYERKISGPIVDRIDVWLTVPQVDPKKLSDYASPEEPSVIIRERVIKARQIQEKRFTEADLAFRTNSEMGVRELRRLAALTPPLTDLLNTSAKRLDLSARAYHRIIKLARTIADLAATEKIEEPHLLEALQYRPKK